MPTSTAQLVYRSNKQIQNANVNKNAASKFNYGIFEGRKEKSIERCIDLLVHTAGCHNVGFCKEGEGCRRTKQVLVHNRTCLNMKEGECTICQQFVALCCLHAQRCKARMLSCCVPHCRNGKLLPSLGMNKQKKESFSKVAKVPFQVTKKAYFENKEKALLMLSLMKRKQNSRQMLKNNPRMNELLKELYEMKKSEIEFQTKPGGQIDQKVPLAPTFSKEDISSIEPTGTDPGIPWFANVSFMPM